MLLPEAERAVIAPEKILRYLLDPTNPRNSGKHVVFFALGYTREAWERLRDDLLAHGRAHPVAGVEPRGQATMYNVDGVLTGPSGRTRRIRTVWRVDRVGVPPRLITAFPAPSGRQ